MEKMLVVVVDGSIKLDPHWKNIQMIIESITRKFCANDASTSMDPFGRQYNLNLVVNAAKDDSTVQFDPTLSMDSFLYLLSRLNFNDESPLGKSGVIEALSKALMMFPSIKNRTQTQLPWKRHCVLVTASPYPFPRVVPIPTYQFLESGEVGEVRVEPVLADAQTVARSFAKSFISLSVICPNDMMMLRTIYDAGNQVPGSFTMRLKHPQLLLLISQQFPEAEEALQKFKEENYDYTNSQQDPLHLLIAEGFSAEDFTLLQMLMSKLEKNEQADDTMPIMTDEEMSTMLNEPTLEGDMNNIVDVTLPRNLSSEAPSGHMKAWEGSLASRGPGVTLFITKLVAYKKPTVPERIFENWPKMMQLNHLVSLTHLHNCPLIQASKQYDLIFSVLDPCPTWDLMKSKSLCGYVDLLEQTLILQISEEDETRLMGILCEEIIPVFRHRIVNPWS